MSPIGRKKCIPDLVLHRVECRACGTLWWPTLPFMIETHRFVRSFALRVLDMLRLAPIRAVAEFSNSVSTTSILRGARQPDEPGKPTLAYSPPLRLVSLVLISQRRQEVQRIPAGRGGWPLKDVAEDHARYRSRGAQTSIECIVAIPCANNQRADNQAPEVDEDESKMKVMIRMTNAAAGIAFRGMPDGGKPGIPQLDGTPVVG